MILIITMTVINIIRINTSVLKNEINGKHVVFELSLLFVVFIALIITVINDNDIYLTSFSSFGLMYLYIIIIYLLGSSAFDKMALNKQRQKLEDLVHALAIGTKE